MNSNQNTLQSFLSKIGMATIAFDVDSVVTACNSLSEKLLGDLSILIFVFFHQTTGITN